MSSPKNRALPLSEARAFVPSASSPQAVSLVPASIPSAWEIDDAVSEWHIGAGGEGIELHEFLGWTFEEYSRWVQSEQSIPLRPLSAIAAQAIEARRAETLGSVHESAVPTGCAQPEPSS